MAEVATTTPIDDAERSRMNDLDSKLTEEDPNPSSPTPHHQQPPQQTRKIEEGNRDSRDDRDTERHGNRRGGGGGGGYERDRSPPPMSRGMMNRGGGGFKRRASSPGSPPPHRRYSPGRRSPTGYKRSRRDDGGGFDGRRGGYGPGGGGDRRFGYEVDGGYDREVGGRLQYGNDRQGRFMGRGPPDMGRGAYRDASSTKREGLMPYKLFLLELEDDILPSEADRRYEEYKSEFIATQKRAYFAAHKDEEWLKDKYHPGNLLAVIERRNEIARKVAKDFILDLQNGTLDVGPGVTAASSDKSGQPNDPNSDFETEADGKRKRLNSGSAKEIDLCSAAPKAHPVSSDSRRVQADIEQALALICKLDDEKGIEENILRGADNNKSSRDVSGPVIIIRGLTSVKGLEGVELLDSLLTYLWRVHGVDYYGMIETNEPKGLRHVREESRTADATSNASEWEKTLDSHWQDRLLGQDPLEIMTAKEKLEAAAVEALDPFVRKIRDEKYGWKYGCGAKGCTKLFHAAEFVHKHLKLKHPELATDMTSKVREDLYFQNYMNDPNAPGGKPVMQQLSVKDRLQKRRYNLDNRLRDDRGSHRDRDNRAGGERYDRNDNIHLNDDGPDGMHDDPAFDAYDGQGMHGGPPYSTEIAPPSVLMPVPGAGPLGPFVPAPPDVAMRLLREQGGPPPYEGVGRNGRPGPQGSGPLLLNPAFRQDPRRLRSYNDLDAPEDEVTVIDYRSL